MAKPLAGDGFLFPRPSDLPPRWAALPGHEGVETSKRTATHYAAAGAARFNPIRRSAST
jgi:hypothetical protein